MNALKLVTTKERHGRCVMVGERQVIQFLCWSEDRPGGRYQVSNAGRWVGPLTSQAAGGGGRCNTVQHLCLGCGVRAVNTRNPAGSPGRTQPGSGQVVVARTNQTPELECWPWFLSRRAGVVVGRCEEQVGAALGPASLYLPADLAVTGVTDGDGGGPGSLLVSPGQLINNYRHTKGRVPQF